MVLTLSAVLFLGAVVAFLCRYAGLRVWHAIICTLFGYYLAASTLAPLVDSVINTLEGLLS